MSFLSDAAKWYREEEHQKAAWDALEALLPQYLLTDFQEAYRGAQSAPTPPPASPLITLTKDLFGQLTGYNASLFTQSECDDCNKMLDATGFRNEPEAACMFVTPRFPLKVL